MLKSALAIFEVDMDSLAEKLQILLHSASIDVVAVIVAISSLLLLLLFIFSSSMALHTIWHMEPTIAQVELESAPPESGKRNPEAPECLR